MPRVFNLVLTGRVAAGHARETAAAALAKTLRLPLERALELLAGKETIIKRGMDEAAIARYLDAIKPTGADVRVDEILQAPASAPLASAPPAPAPPQAKPQPVPVAAETVKCPACGTEQPKRNLCRQCGGDIRRLLAATTEAASKPMQESSSAPLRGGARSLPGTIRVEEGSFTPHPLNAFSFEGRIGRLRYLAYCFPAYLPIIGAAIVGGVLGGMGKSMGMFITLLIVGGLATMLLGLRLAVLRLHDLNLSGKWVFLPVVPMLAIFTGSPVLMIASGGIMFLGMLAMSFWPGSMMSNDYGSPPEPNTFWTIVGAVSFVLLSVIGGLMGGGAPEAES